MDYPKIVLTGHRGLIGWHLFTRWLECKLILTIPDITDFETSKKLIWEFEPQILIHCAGYTNVDAAEDNEAKAFKVNAEGTENMARIAAKLNIPILYLSTDAIFDGTKETPYTKWDTPNPQSVYGKSKLQGEYAVQRHTDKHYILRTNWVYGKGRDNFITNCIKKCRETEDPTVFMPIVGQVGSPTNVNNLVKAIETLIDTERYGTYHYTDSGKASRTEVCSYITKKFGKELLVNQWKGKAPRPRYTVLENTFFAAPHWKESLDRFIDEGN